MFRLWSYTQLSPKLDAQGRLLECPRCDGSGIYKRGWLYSNEPPTTPLPQIEPCTHPFHDSTESTT